MSKALSLDLRVRVLMAVANGASHREAAARFGVSAASVSRWRALERRQGDARPTQEWEPPADPARFSPAAHRFVGDVDAALGQQVLDIAIAQGEPKVEPDRVLDDDRREATASVGNGAHARA